MLFSFHDIPVNFIWIIWNREIIMYTRVLIEKGIHLQDTNIQELDYESSQRSIFDA